MYYGVPNNNGFYPKVFREIENLIQFTSDALCFNTSRMYTSVFRRFSNHKWLTIISHFRRVVTYIAKMGTSNYTSARLD